MFKMKDFDRGYAETKKRLAEIGKRKVTVGIHGKDDARGDELTNVELATIHEFGAGNNPERSFLRRTLDEHGAEYATYARELALKVIDGKLTSERALGLLGMKVKSDVIRLFDTNQINPDISDATKARKGSSTVLIDTASLKQAIDFVVRGLLESAGGIT